MMMQPPPKSIRENISRAKAYLRRNEVIRALEATRKALHEHITSKPVGQARYEAEVHIHELVTDLNRHPEIINFFYSKKIYATPFLKFGREMEAKLLEQLDAVIHGMGKDLKESEEAEAEKKFQKKQEMLERGTELIKAGEYPRGKGLLRRVIDGWGDEPGLITQIALLFLEHSLNMEAAELFEIVIEKFPSDSKAYGGAVKAYRALVEFERCEVVYKKAIKQFGAHPRTIMNLAKLYYDWKRLDDAYEYIKQARKLDPSLPGSEELQAAIEKHIF